MTPQESWLAVPGKNYTMTSGLLESNLGQHHGSK